MYPFSLRTYLLIFLIFIFVKSIRTLEEIGWISSCKDGFNFTSNQCSHAKSGIWLEKEIYPKNCICAKGLWVLSTKFCDDNDLLLFGNGHCFPVTKKIHKIQYLGSTSTVFSPANFIWANFKNGIYQRLKISPDVVGNQNVRIIRINPRQISQPLKSTDQSQEISQPLMSTDPTQDISSYPHIPYGLGATSEENLTNQVSIIKITSNSLSLEFFGTQDENNCTTENQKFQAFTLLPDQGFFLGENKRIFSKPIDAELLLETHKRERRFLPDDQFDVKGYFGPSYSGVSPFDKNNLEKYLTEQNVRLVKKELNYIKYLQTEPEFRLNDSTYQLLQMSRVILNSVCPLRSVPIGLTHTLIRLFRFLLLERRDNNLYGKSHMDANDHAIIMQTLEACYNDSGTMVFLKEQVTRRCVGDHPLLSKIYEGIANNSKDPRTTTTTTSTAAPEIPEKKICDCRITVIGVALNETTNNTCTGLDKDQEWNHTKRDFIVEAMWKTFQFTHFQCAKHFEANPRAAAVFHETLERLFHADMIFRWNNPGETSRAFWQYFFMNYDLQQYAKAMDTCLCAAQDWSIYRYPMVRPTVPVFRKRRSSMVSRNQREEENVIISEPAHILSAQCLQHPWDPIQNMEESSC